MEKDTISVNDNKHTYTHTYTISLALIKKKFRKHNIESELFLG